MTIAAAYLVSDGIVFGADSSTTVQIATPQGAGVVQLLNHSQKVFEIGANSRLGLCTWGAGSIGKLSHRTIVAQLSEEIQEDTTVEDASKKLIEIVEPYVKEAGIDFVGYYLGGWEPKTHLPACFHIGITKNESKLNPLTLGLCSFSGNAMFFSRVFRGYDQQLPELLLKSITEKLTDEQKEPFKDVFNKSFKEATAPLVTAGFQDLPIREAIDFIYSYLHITVKAEKFKYGPSSCGGPIEVGFITSDRNFRWVRHKPFFSAIIEQEGEYDVE